MALGRARRYRLSRRRRRNYRYYPLLISVNYYSIYRRHRAVHVGPADRIASSSTSLSRRQDHVVFGRSA